MHVHKACGLEHCHQVLIYPRLRSLGPLRPPVHANDGHSSCTCTGIEELSARGPLPEGPAGGPVGQAASRGPVVRMGSTLLLNHAVASVITAMRYNAKWAVVPRYYVSPASRRGARERPQLQRSVRANIIWFVRVTARAGGGPQRAQQVRCRVQGFALGDLQVHRQAWAQQWKGWDPDMTPGTMLQPAESRWLPPCAVVAMGTTVACTFFQLPLACVWHVVAPCTHSLRPRSHVILAAGCRHGIPARCSLVLDAHRRLD